MLRVSIVLLTGRSGLVPRSSRRAGTIAPAGFRSRTSPPIEGVRDNPLVGLRRGGRIEPHRRQSANGLLDANFGQSSAAHGSASSRDSIRVNNMAAVFVTATLPPFARPGMKIDVTVSSAGDAKSLAGGLLLMTPLKAADGNVYAVAQGPSRSAATAQAATETRKSSITSPSVACRKAGSWSAIRPSISPHDHAFSAAARSRFRGRYATSPPQSTRRWVRKLRALWIAAAWTLSALLPRNERRSRTDGAHRQSFR